MNQNPKIKIVKVIKATGGLSSQDLPLLSAKKASGSLDIAYFPQKSLTLTELTAFFNERDLVHNVTIKGLEPHYEPYYSLPKDFIQATIKHHNDNLSIPKKTKTYTFEEILLKKRKYSFIKVKKV